MIKKILLLLAFNMMPMICYANICQYPEYLYKFAGLGICLPIETNVKVNIYDDYKSLRLTYKKIPINIEIGNLHYGHIYEHFGEPHKVKFLKNISNNKIDKWVFKDNVLSISVFSISDSNIFIFYQGNAEQTRIGDDFMESLFLLPNENS
ncbi:MAG: hypothetical protein Q3971_08680 [Moraxella sp.]|nr:hypothetical protein [Moraxella sp.]